MPFEESVAATPQGFLEAMVSFAVTNAGFTQHPSMVIAGYQDDVLIIQKGSIYWWFGALDSVNDSEYGPYGQIRCRMMLVLPTAANYLDRTNGTYYTGRMSLFNRPIGPYISHRFYTNLTGDAVHAVLEIAPLVFVHMSFGKVQKYYPAAGGEYLTSTSFHVGSDFVASTGWKGTQNGQLSSIIGCLPFCGRMDATAYNSDINGFGHLYNPIDAFGDNRDFSPQFNQATSSYANSHFQSFQPSGDATTSTNTNTQKGLLLGLVFPYSHNNGVNRRSILFPSYHFVHDSRDRNVNSPAFIYGEVPDIKVVNITNLDPKQTVDVSWDIYPYVQKAGDHFAYPVSGQFGLAINRIG